MTGATTRVTNHAHAARVCAWNRRRVGARRTRARWSGAARASAGDVPRPGNVVSLHYKMTLRDGTVVDDTRSAQRGNAPASVTLGDGALFPALSAELGTMRRGDARTVVLPANDAFGMRDDAKIQRFPLSSEESAEMRERVHVGQLVQLPDGSRALVLELADDGVTLDLNHPLAGQDLTFELELVDFTEGATIFGVQMVNFTPSM